MWLKSAACESLPQLSLKSAGAVSFTAGEAELELKIRMKFIPGFIPESESLILKPDGFALSGFLLSWREGRIPVLVTIEWLKLKEIHWFKFPEFCETLHFHLKKKKEKEQK